MLITKKRAERKNPSKWEKRSFKDVWFHLFIGGLSIGIVSNVNMFAVLKHGRNILLQHQFTQLYLCRQQQRSEKRQRVNEVMHLATLMKIVLKTNCVKWPVQIKTLNNWLRYNNNNNNDNDNSNNNAQCETKWENFYRILSFFILSLCTQMFAK